MTWLKIIDNVRTTLTAILATDELSISVASGVKFPAVGPVVITITDGSDYEKILVDSRSSNTLTVNAAGRGYGGTTATVHAVGESVYIGSIQQPIEELQTAVDGKVAHSLATAENDFLVGAPSPFGTWVRKTLAQIKTILGLGTAAYTASGDYAILAGRSGGQTLYGGTGAGDNLSLLSTSNGTKGKVSLGSLSAYDEVNDRLGIGTLTPTQALDIANAGSICFTPIPPPLTACTATLVAEAGLVTSGPHKYRITFLTAQGETLASPASNEVITVEATHGKVQLSNIPISSNELVTQRRIYRTDSVDSMYYYAIAVLDNNTETTYLDNLSDDDIYAFIPGCNFCDDGSDTPLYDTSTGRIYYGSSILGILNQGQIAIGLNALGLDTNGKNLAIGTNALAANVTGSGNSAIGRSALTENIDGNNNTALGLAALRMNTGGGNTAVGSNALASNIIGEANTALGMSSLAVNTAGHNTAVGYRSLGEVTTGIGNTALGHKTGDHELVTGAYNTFLGWQASLSSADRQRSYAVALGYGALVDVNYGVVLGSITNALVGIRTATPAYPLDVNGDVNVRTGGAFRINGTAISATDVGAVPNSLFDAYTILHATSDNTPIALTVGEQTMIGRITGGAIAALTATQIRTLLNVADGANAYVHPNHSGDVTSTSDGATAIAANAVTLAKLATQAAETILANATASAAVPTALALAEQTVAGRITGGHVVGLTATQIRTLINVADGADATPAASDTVVGKVELAISAEVDTGTDATRAITPDAFAGSNYGRRLVQLKIMDDTTVLTTGDGKLYFHIPIELNGWNLVLAHACLSTVSSSGAPVIMVYNVTDSQDMLSTGITIAQSAFTTYTGGAGAINTSYDDVATADMLRIDCDTAGTGAKGLELILSFAAP